jgi:hypothetical protein
MSMEQARGLKASSGERCVVQHRDAHMSDKMLITYDTGKTGDAGLVLLTAQRCSIGTMLSKGSVANLGITSCIWLSPATPPSPHGHGPVFTLSDIVDILLAYK